MKVIKNIGYITLSPMARRWFSLNLIMALIVGLLASTQLPIVPARAASSYYVATSGSNSNPGSLSQPFATIQKCASVALAGDTCFIRGGTYRETVTPVNSGTTSAPITFQPYNGESVTVSGADILTGWSIYSGNIYQASATLASGYDTTLFANQIFVDSQMVNEARWPNTGTDLLHPTEATAGSGTTCGSINDTNLPSGSWIGATIYINGGYGWNAQTGTVTSYTAGSSVSFSGANTDCPDLGAKQGSLYYLTGKLIALDAAGEWFYDNSVQKLYLWTPNSDSPASHVIEVKKRNFAFDLSGHSNITIRGLNIFAATITTDTSSSNTVIDGITAKFITHFVTIPNDPNFNSCGAYCSHGTDTGIQIRGSNSVVENSTIIYSAGSGIYATGNGTIISNNLMHELNYSGIYNMGINLAGTGQTASNNTVYNTGRTAIWFTHNNDRITYNNVYNFMLLGTDAGGIASSDGNASNPNNYSTVVSYNWAHDAVDRRATFSGASPAAGFYFDSGANNYTIHHNVAWNGVGDGIFLHGDYSHSSVNNLVYNNTLGAGQIMSIQISDATAYTGSRVVNNLALGSIDNPGNAIYEANNQTYSSGTQFANSGANDYQLQSNSAAIDAGQLISGVTDGYNGSSPDLGAYEYGGAVWTPGCNFSGCQSGGGANKNFLADPGFEAGVVTPWIQWTGVPAVSVVSSNTHSGGYAIQVGASYSGMSQIVSNLTPNTTYSLTGWGKVANSGEQVVMGLKNYGGAEQYQTISSTSYTLGTISFTTGSSNTSVEIYFYKNTGSGNGYGDDFAITTVPINLVSNPGFESGSLSPWIQWTGVPAVSVVTSNTHSGGYAIQVGASYSGMSQIVSNLTPNTTYSLTGWGKVANSGEQVVMGLKNYGGAEQTQTVSSTSYTLGTISFTTGSSNTSVEIYFYKNTGSGNGYGDDFAVIKS